MKASTQGAFKRPSTSFEETEPTERRTMCDGRKMLPQGEDNTPAIVQPVGTSVRIAALTSRSFFLQPQVVRRLLCMNNCGSFAVSVGGGAREHVRQERSDILRCL